MKALHLNAIAITIFSLCCTSSFALTKHYKDEGHKSSANISHGNDFADVDDKSKKNIKGRYSAQIDLKTNDDMSDYKDGRDYIESFYKSKYVVDNGGGTGRKGQASERRVLKEGGYEQIHYKKTTDGKSTLPNGFHDSTYIVSSGLGEMTFDITDIDCSKYSFDIYRTTSCPAGMMTADNNIAGWAGGSRWFNSSTGDGYGIRGTYNDYDYWAMIGVPFNPSAVWVDGTRIASSTNFTNVLTNIHKYMIHGKEIAGEKGVEYWYNYSFPRRTLKGEIYFSTRSNSNKHLWYTSEINDGKITPFKGRAYRPMWGGEFANMQNGISRGVMAYHSEITPLLKIKVSLNSTEEEIKNACIASVNLNNTSTFRINKKEEWVGDNCANACPERPRKRIDGTKTACPKKELTACDVAKVVLNKSVLYTTEKTNLCNTKYQLQTVNKKNKDEDKDYPNGYTQISYEVEPAFYAGKGYYKISGEQVHACEIYKRNNVKTLASEGDCEVPDEEIRTSWNQVTKTWKEIYDVTGICVYGCGTGTGTKRSRWVLQEEITKIKSIIGNGYNSNSVPTSGGTLIQDGERGSTFQILGTDGKSYGNTIITRQRNKSGGICYFVRMRPNGLSETMVYEINPTSINTKEMTATIQTSISCVRNL